MNIIIVSNRPFPNRDATNPEELQKLVDRSTRSCIFFPFWSWKVPKDILDKHLCIGFHTGNVKGGSPIQNLIRSNVETSTIKMFNMNNEIDGGEVINERVISLLGSLEEILIRQTKIISEMIDAYIHSN